MTDPDLQIRVGGHPDPEIRGDPGLQKMFYGPDRRLHRPQLLLLFQFASSLLCPISSFCQPFFYNLYSSGRSSIDTAKIVPICF